MFTVTGQPSAQQAGEFYFSSIYTLPNNTFSLSVNRGRFPVTPPSTPGSEANTRCLNDPAQQGIPDTSNSPIVVQHVNPWGEPPGYNRRRRSILNAPYIAPEPDGADVYLTYFNGKTPLQQGGGIFSGPLAKQADIIVATSHDNGVPWTPVKVNDDPGLTSHVFPSIQVNKNGWVYAGWMDRRIDPTNNELTDTWAAVSHDGGATFGPTASRATSPPAGASEPTRARISAISSALLDDNQFLMIWADRQVPAPGTDATGRDS